MGSLSTAILRQCLLRTGLMLLLITVSGLTAAANQPCSGKKGGIARCDGALFVCNDGSISGSKRHCSAERAGSRSSSSARLLPAISSECACGSGTLCTGPKGGQYCLTPSGNKSYKRR